MDLDLIAWITHLLCAILGFHQSVGLLTCPIQAVTTNPKPASFICFQNLKYEFLHCFQKQLIKKNLLSKSNKKANTDIYLFYLKSRYVEQKPFQEWWKGT